MFNNQEYNYTNITTATTTQVANGKGKLQAITINTAAGTVTVLDGDATSTVPVAIISAAAVPATYWYNTYFARGLRIVTSGAANITVSWAQA